VSNGSGGFAETATENREGVSHLGQAKVLPGGVAFILKRRISKGKSIHEEKIDDHAREDRGENNDPHSKITMHFRRSLQRQSYTDQKQCKAKKLRKVVCWCHGSTLAQIDTSDTAIVPN